MARFQVGHSRVCGNLGDIQKDLSCLSFHHCAKENQRQTRGYVLKTNLIQHDDNRLPNGLLLFFLLIYFLFFYFLNFILFLNFT